MDNELKGQARMQAEKLADALQNANDKSARTQFECVMKRSRYREILKTMESLTKELSSPYFLQAQENTSC